MINVNMSIYKAIIRCIETEEGEIASRLSIDIGDAERLANELM